MAFHVSVQMLLCGAVFAGDQAWLFAPVFRRVSSAEPRLAVVLLLFTVATALHAEVKRGRSVRRALRQHRKSEASTSVLVRLQGCPWQQKRRRRRGITAVFEVQQDFLPSVQVCSLSQSVLGPLNLAARLAVGCCHAFFAGWSCL